LVDAFQILLVNQRDPLDTGCRSIPYLHSTKSIRCGLMVPDFVCWACHHKWGPVYIQPSAPVSRDQRASLGTTCSWPSDL